MIETIFAMRDEHGRYVHPVMIQAAVRLAQDPQGLALVETDDGTVWAMLLGSGFSAAFGYQVTDTGWVVIVAPPMLSGDLGAASQALLALLGQ